MLGSLFGLFTLWAYNIYLFNCCNPFELPETSTYGNSETLCNNTCISFRRSAVFCCLRLSPCGTQCVGYGGPQILILIVSHKPPPTGGNFFFSHKAGYWTGIKGPNPILILHETWAAEHYVWSGASYLSPLSTLLPAFH